MKNYMDKMTDKYIKDVKNILPFVRKEEKEYLYNLELEIKGYIEAHRMTDFKYVIEKFGSPCDVAMDYIEHHIDEKTMLKMRKRSKILKVTAITSAVVLSAAVAGACIYKKCLYDEQNK